MTGALGTTRWAIPEGYLPHDDPEKPRELVSHEAACLLNTSERDAHVRLTIYFAQREPVGPYHVTVPARRTLHLRLGELTDPARIPAGTEYASVFESDVPIVVQYTRLDSRNGAHALLSSLAFPAE